MSIALRRSGRISFVLLAGIAALILVGLLFFVTKDSPASAATKFMSALAKGDAKTLAQCSSMGDRSEAQMQTAWEESLKYSKYVAFRWIITDSSEISSDRATVKLELSKASFGNQAVPEHFELEMVKVNGAWKVDVLTMPRTMYPFLPQ